MIKSLLGGMALALTILSFGCSTTEDPLETRVSALEKGQEKLEKGQRKLVLGGLKQHDGQRKLVLGGIKQQDATENHDTRITDATAKANTAETRALEATAAVTAFRKSQDTLTKKVKVIEDQIPTFKAVSPEKVLALARNVEAMRSFTGTLAQRYIVRYRAMGTKYYSIQDTRYAPVDGRPIKNGGVGWIRVFSDDGQSISRMEAWVWLWEVDPISGHSHLVRHEPFGKWRPVALHGGDPSKGIPPTHGTVDGFNEQGRPDCLVLKASEGFPTAFQPSAYHTVAVVE